MAAWDGVRKTRARTAATRLVIGLALFGAATARPGDALATPVACYDASYNNILCSNPTGFWCLDYQDGNCQAAGYTESHGFTQGQINSSVSWLWKCSSNVPGCGAAIQTPEMDGYAVETFLVLAVLIGWHTRRRYAGG